MKTNKAVYFFLIPFTLLVSLHASAQEKSSKAEKLEFESYLDIITEASELIKSDTSLALKEIKKVELGDVLMLDSNYNTLVSKKINFFEKHYLEAEAIANELKAAIQKNQEHQARQIFLRDKLAQIYFNDFKFEEALVQLNALEKYYKEESQPEKSGEILLRKSTVFYSKGEYIKSIETTFKAIDQFKISDQDKHLAFAYLQIGSTYLFIDFLDEAASYYNLAGEKFMKLGDTLGKAICESNVALVEYEKSNYGKAISILHENLPTIIKSERKTMSSFAYQSLSDCYFKLGNYDSALFYINQSYEIDRDLEYSMGLAKDYAILAQLTYLNNEKEKALNFGNKALQQLEYSEDYDLHSQVVFLLAELYSQKGDLRKSNFYLRRHIDFKDSLKVENGIITKITQKENIKLKRTEFELELAKQKDKIQEKENINQLNIIRGLVIVLAIFVVGIILISIINRKNKGLNEELIQKKKQLEDELTMNKSLLKEIHHRVKNNLQVISSMLSIQAQYLKDKKFEKIIDECRGRINSMSLIHESLYKSESKRNPLFNEYIEELIPQLIETYQVDQNQLKLTLNVDPIELSLDESMPCGLIINEVVSNSIKHAFPNGRNGEIYIEMKELDNEIKLKIADNGVGISSNFKPQDQNTFGFLLIYTFAAQLEAEVKVDTSKGLSYEFSWEKGL